MTINELAELIYTTGNKSGMSGHVKRWKAAAMAGTIMDMRAIGVNWAGARLERYVGQCLEMEGFLPSECVEIANVIDEVLK